MLRVAPDSSTVERTLQDLYPGEIKVVDWEKCCLCDAEVDAYIYAEEVCKGYCFEHYHQSSAGSLDYGRTSNAQ